MKGWELLEWENVMEGIDFFFLLLCALNYSLHAQLMCCASTSPGGYAKKKMCLLKNLSLNG